MYQTEPTQGTHSGQQWDQSHGSVQYSSQAPSAANGFSNDGLSSFDPFHLSEGGHAMSRQISIGAQSVMTTHSYDQGLSGSIYSSLSQMPYQISSVGSDGSARSDSPEFTPTPQLGQSDFDNFASIYGDSITNDHKDYQKDSTIDVQAHMLTNPPFSCAFQPSEDSYMSNFIHSQALMAKEGMYDTSNDSSALYSHDFQDPHQISLITTDDIWAHPMSSMHSPTAYSPSEDSHSSLSYGLDVADVPHTNVRSVKKTGPRQSKVNSDIARNSRPNGASDMSDEPVKFPGRTQDVDNHARDHELYHNAAPKSDGLYHCPWEGQECCQHRPEKLKCNYEYDYSPSSLILIA